LDVEARPLDQCRRHRIAARPVRDAGSVEEQTFRELQGDRGDGCGEAAFAQLVARRHQPENVMAEQPGDRTGSDRSRGVADLLGGDVHGRTFDLEYVRRADSGAFVTERQAHIRHVHSAAPKLMVDPRMLVYPGATLMHHKRDPLRRIVKRMAFGSKVANAGTGLPHDRDLVAQRPMLQASLHSAALRQEPHLVIGRSGTQTFP
jgi:hypothetical protein